jgi:predicted metal-dependent phosphotriesterase family hydrolase
MVQRGAWIGHDGVGSEGQTDEEHLERILCVLDASLGDRLMLSHHQGWYDLAQPGEYTRRPFVYISGFAWPS